MSVREATLLGGSQGLPPRLRVRWVTTTADTIKVQFGSGYEHFVYDEERTIQGGGDVLVFHWVAHTEIAE
ncbi:DUF5988 family protein [Amycolatopsis sp. NPDC024027]|uniref:DUF5988 family protein n=1 Tax=Amycolatopsis sp. NPDC024027 TaxID=3154327 RepID=UPI0033D28416